MRKIFFKKISPISYKNIFTFRKTIYKKFFFKKSPTRPIREIWNKILYKVFTISNVGPNFSKMYLNIWFWDILIYNITSYKKDCAC